MVRTLVVIPAFNEEKNIGKVLDDICKEQPFFDIVVVNDGSSDRTEEIVRSKNITVINLPFNLGYGGALQTGFLYASKAGYDNIIQFDGDGQHDVADILKIYECLMTGDYDIVIGSRFTDKSKNKSGLMKRAGYVLLRFFIKLLTGERLSDPTSGLKGLNRKIFNYFLISEHYSIDYPDADILIQALRADFRFKEIPINVYERVHGESMHSGLKPIFYFMKFALNTLVIIIREKRKGGK